MRFTFNEFSCSLSSSASQIYCWENCLIFWYSITGSQHTGWQAVTTQKIKEYLQHACLHLAVWKQYDWSESGADKDKPTALIQPYASGQNIVMGISIPSPHLLAPCCFYTMILLPTNPVKKTSNCVFCCFDYCLLVLHPPKWSILASVSDVPKHIGYSRGSFIKRGYICGMHIIVCLASILHMLNHTFNLRYKSE